MVILHFNDIISFIGKKSKLKQIHNGKKGKTDNVHILLQEVDYLGIFGTSAEQQIFFPTF